MSGDQPIAKFAARRPDWELPQLQLEQLKLHPFDALEQATSRQPCPKWCVVPMLSFAALWVCQPLPEVAAQLDRDNAQ
jgi:hypothetical protein